MPVNTNKMINYDKFVKNHSEFFTALLNSSLNLEMLKQFDENPIFKKRVADSINKIRTHHPKSLKDIVKLLEQDHQLFTHLQRAAAAYQIENNTSHLYKILKESKSEYVNNLTTILNDLLPGGRTELIDILQGDKKAFQDFLAQHPSVRNLLHPMMTTLLTMHPQLEATRVNASQLPFFTRETRRTAVNGVIPKREPPTRNTP